MIRFITAFVFAFAATAMVARAAEPAAPPAMQLPPQPATRPLGIPADALLVSPCVAAMGEHWMAMKNAPMGPIYGVWQGKPIFSEIMVPLSELQKGYSYANLQALPGYSIDHIDFAFEPTGHPGMPVPHYDLHAYYVSAAEQAKICPDGIPNPAMKPMNVTPGE